jgi:hypothetical protein
VHTKAFWSSLFFEAFISLLLSIFLEKDFSLTVLRRSRSAPRLPVKFRFSSCFLVRVPVFDSPVVATASVFLFLLRKFQAPWPAVPSVLFPFHSLSALN